uniref:Uncharacterized protein n=1 Tax=Anguilla anguilla TaxID=7936 RepID=A0A0E9RBW2_ANGAN
MKPDEKRSFFFYSFFSQLELNASSNHNWIITAIITIFD